MIKLRINCQTSSLECSFYACLIFKIKQFVYKWCESKFIFSFFIKYFLFRNGKIENR